jgi:hypothetical protein
VSGYALSLAGPAFLVLYRESLGALGSVGAFREEVKKTSIQSPRIFKAEQVSEHRWHLEVKLTAASEIDSEP